MRRQLEVSIMTLEEDLRKLTDGDGSFNLLYKYATGLGTGLKAFQSAKDEVERQLDKVRKELAALPEPSKFEKIKAEYIEDYGNEVAYKESLSAYIDALEKCRPWVIRRKCGDSLWEYEGTDGAWHVAMFSSKAEAVAYAGSVGARSSWEVVQWEGNE